MLNFHRLVLVARDPGPDDLSPSQVEALLKQNSTPFNNFAQKLTDAALVALRAVDARNIEGPIRSRGRDRSSL